MNGWLLGQGGHVGSPGVTGDLCNALVQDWRIQLTVFVCLMLHSSCIVLGLLSMRQPSGAAELQ
jgi:hypothetical protein